VIGPALLSRPVEISAIGTAASVKKIEATEKERREISVALSLLDVGALSAELTLNRDKDGTIHVIGRVVAEIVQHCVVSLDPVSQTIDEPIALSFIQERSRVLPAGTKAAAINVDPTQDDPPEVVSGSIIDLGSVTLEHFILAIDPYPRAPDRAAPGDFAEDTAGKDDSPFAVLENLGVPKSKDR